MKKQPYPQERLDCVDYAKGICIIAVVSMYGTISVEEWMRAEGWMHYFVTFAQPFRMPDFFFLSGLFVARVIDRPLRVYIDTKVLHFMYFYALWVSLKFAFGNPHERGEANWFGALASYLSLYIQPSGPLWFICMLAMFFIAVRLVRPLPVPVVIFSAVALQLAGLDTGWKLIDRFGLYFVFFFVGHVLAPKIVCLAAWARNHMRLTTVLLAFWFSANAILVRLNLTYVPAVLLVTGFVGAIAILLLSVLLSRLSWMRWLQYLGANSIVIFLGFVVPMSILHKLIIKYQMLADVGTISIVVVVASIVGSLLMYWAVRHTPLRVLFIRPAWASIQLPASADSNKMYSQRER